MVPMEPAGRWRQTKNILELNLYIFITQPDFISHDLTIGGRGRLAAVRAPEEDSGCSVLCYRYTGMRTIASTNTGSPASARVKTHPVHPAVGSFLAPGAMPLVVPVESFFTGFDNFLRLSLTGIPYCFLTFSSSQAISWPLTPSFTIWTFIGSMFK